MSFSRKVKEELISQTGNGRHCLIAEFAAIFALAGKIKKDRYGDTYLEIRTENLTVARKSYILIEYAFCVKADIRVQNHNIRAKSTNYCLIIKEHRNVLMVLKAIKVIDDTGKLWGAYDKVHPLLVQNTCCKRAYLRGAFLVAGSITDPQKAYHLEIATASEEYAHSLQKVMQSFSMDAKIVLRKKYFVLYIKEGTQIVDFLNVIEAHIALMDFENIRILKEVRNSVNRQVNCETANINKTVTAAAKQIEDIQYLQEHMGFSQLADGLKEIAELRLEYPDSSLVELGKMLSKPIGKSGVNHRLRKISEFAEQLREKNGFVTAK